MGIFGTAGGLQNALGGLSPQALSSVPGGKAAPSSGRRRGLFGGRFDPAQAQQMLAIAQAAMAGDYAAMGTMASQMQRNRLLQEQARAEAEAQEAQFLSAHEALAARGVDKHAIHAMRPEEWSRAIMERINPVTLSPEQERLTPGAPGAAPHVYRAAPGSYTLGDNDTRFDGGNNIVARGTQTPIVVNPNPGTVSQILPRGEPYGSGGGAPQTVALPLTAEQINQQADAAIAAGRDPAQVNARRQQMLQQIGGATPSGSANFPGGGFWR